LGYYFLKAKKNGVPFCCTCVIPKQIPISDTDLCIVLGNGLENAIEASKKLDDLNARFLSVKARICNGQLLIKIENSYDGDLNVNGNDYLSTKTEAFHGMGLPNIQKVLQACGGYVKTEHSGKAFTLLAAFPCSLDAAEKQIEL
jgi:sensor histidine kinase regulating citrate/malate metabolism